MKSKHQYLKIVLVVVALLSLSFSMEGCKNKGGMQQEISGQNREDSVNSDLLVMPDDDDVIMVEEDNATDVSDIEQPTPSRDDDLMVGEEDEDEGFESNDGFQSLDDIHKKKKAEYFERLLEYSEKELKDELAKGSAANQTKVKELRESITILRKSLAELKQ